MVSMIHSVQSRVAAVTILTRVYLKSVAFLLLLTAVGKLILAFGDAKVIGEQNPAFGFLSNRQVLFLAAALELVVLGCLLMPRLRDQFGILMIAWLATVFFAYR